MIVLVAGAGVAYLARAQARDLLPWSGPAACSPAPVSVVVAPEVLGAVQEVLRSADGRRVTRTACVSVTVTSQDPQQTVAAIAVLPPDRWPQLWIPDSSLWVERVGALRVNNDGSFATSPVVLAATPPVLERTGWSDAPPRWASALDSATDVVTPLRQSAPGLLAMLAVLRDIGPGPAHARATALLTRQRNDPVTLDDAVASAAESPAKAPLLVTTEQAVSAANLTAESDVLRPVYPADGCPVLDYPVIRVDPQRWDAARRAAVQAVVDTLLGPLARTAALAAGFRDADGFPSSGSPTVTAQLGTVEPASSDDLAALLQLLDGARQPSRVLAVVDVSTSMTAAVGPGVTRISVVRDVGRAAMTQLPSPTAMGVWLFAAQLSGSSSWVQAIGTAPLDTPSSAGSQRDRISGLFTRLPTMLRPGGTALYATVMAAMARARADYDPAAANVVVLLTDGTNDDSAGPTLAEAVARLTKQSGDANAVRLIAIGVGPQADMAALRALAGATPHGRAIHALSAGQLQTALFSALNSD